MTDRRIRNEARERPSVLSKPMPRAGRAQKSVGTPTLLSIGELADRTGVATTALRYYDDLGLVRPAARASGRRRYAEAAVAEVGVILFLREVGFSLAEIGSLVTARERRSWHDVIERKLAAIADQQHRLEVARTALEHARQCPSSEPVRCSRFMSIVADWLRGRSLEESHARAHSTALDRR